MFKSNQFFNLAVVLILFGSLFVGLRGADLKADEIITKHLESLGNEKKRQSIKNLLTIGNSEFIIKIPQSKILGKALIASDSKNLMLISSFPASDYPFEKIGFFDSKINIPFVRPGFRSPLGNYLLLNNQILSNGLFAGSITPSWRFLTLNKEALENGGKKKIGGRETYIIKFFPKEASGADSSIKLYFDAQNFQHLRTEYLQKIPSKNLYPAGIFDAQTGDSINVLTEEFGDFREVEGLTLPHTYSLKLTVDNQVGTNEFQWNILISEYRFNQKFDSSFFTFDR
jgi:hypothetical protein